MKKKPSICFLMEGSILSDYRAYIFQKLVVAGMTEEGCAGLMGNLQSESGILPNRLQGDFTTGYYKSINYTNGVNNGTISRTQFTTDSKGYGLAQWTFSSRKANLYDYCFSHSGDISNLDDQLAFLVAELQADYGSVWNVLTTTTDITIASNTVLTQFERPSDQSERVKEQRAKQGLNLYLELHGSPPIVDPGEPIYPHDYENIPTTQRNFNILPFLVDYGIIYSRSTNDRRTRY